jgi:hypothetical protein
MDSSSNPAGLVRGDRRLEDWRSGAAVGSWDISHRKTVIRTNFCACLRVTGMIVRCHLLVSSLRSTYSGSRVN